MPKRNREKKDVAPGAYEEHFKDGRDKSGYEIVRGSTIKTDRAFVRRPHMNGKKKIAIEYIEDKNRRGVTFSKRKRGIMKKAFELNKLTNSDILLIIANENAHVYTFSTSKFKPLISRHAKLIEDCLKTPSMERDGSEMSDFVSENRYIGGGGYYNYTGNSYSADGSGYYSGLDGEHLDEKENIHNIGTNTASYFSDEEESHSDGCETYECLEDGSAQDECAPSDQYYKQ